MLKVLGSELRNYLNIMVIRVSEQKFGTLIRNIYSTVINKCSVPPTVTSPTPRRGSEPDEEWVKKQNKKTKKNKAVTRPIVAKSREFC